MKIFIVLNDLHAELPCLTMMDFFPICYLDDKVWNIPTQGVEQKKTW